MGCTGSKIKTVPNNSLELKHSKISNEKHPSVAEQSNRVLENCIIIWLINDKLADIKLETTKFRHIVSTLKIFTDRDACIAYITSIRTEKVFLIVPTVDTCVDSFQQLPQTEKIYILLNSFGDSDRNTDLIASSSVFSDIDSLCQQLKIDVELCELDLLVVTAAHQLPKDDVISSEAKKQEAAFLCFQLIKEVLFHLKFENNAKNEFVHFCRSYYADNQEQLNMIDDFEKNYRPQRALWWLTRRCFVGRIQQRMQRTLEVDVLYKLGFILKHAHTQINAFRENSQLLSEHMLPVYRGKTMFADKFNTLVKNNCGGLLSFGSIFTAHATKDGSINFVRRRLATFPHAVGILFEIHIDPTLWSNRSPFVSLSQLHIDDCIEKNGILFTICSVFRITAVEELMDQSMFAMWNVKLHLIDDDDEQLLQHVGVLRSHEIRANPLSFVGKLFMEMEEYAHAEQFFIGMLQDASILSQPRRLVRVHIGLGANYMLTGNYNKAMEQYQQALDISLTYLSPQHIDLVPLYDAIGKGYYHLGDFKKAVEKYENALEIIELCGSSNHDQLIHDLKSRVDNTKKLVDNQ